MELTLKEEIDISRKNEEEKEQIKLYVAIFYIFEEMIFNSMHSPREIKQRMFINRRNLSHIVDYYLNKLYKIVKIH